MTNRWISSLIFSSLLLIGTGRHCLLADEVVLKSGTPISGTIIAEDADEITIINADNMVLHLDKSIIRSVQRSKRQNSTGPLKPLLIKPKKPATLASPSPKIPVNATPSVAPSVQPSPSAEASPVATPSATSKAEPQGNKTKEWKSGIVTVTEYQTIKKVHLGNEKDFVKILERLQSEYESRWTGEVKKDQGSTSWASIHIFSTAVVSVAADRPRLDPQLEKDVEEQLTHERKIQDECLHSLADAFPILQGMTEQELREKSDQLFDDMVTRAEKRRKGFYRVSTRGNKPLNIPKK